MPIDIEQQLRVVAIALQERVTPIDLDEICGSGDIGLDISTVSPSVPLVSYRGATEPPRWRRGAVLAVIAAAAVVIAVLMVALPQHVGAPANPNPLSDSLPGPRTTASHDSGPSSPASATIAGTTTSDTANSGSSPSVNDLATFARLTTDDARTVFDAGERLTQRCMASRGFTYAIQQWAPPIWNGYPAGEPSLYPDDALLRQYGYAWKSSLIQTSPPPTDPPDQPGYLHALEGSPGDCTLVPVDALGYNPYLNISAEFVRAGESIASETKQDPRFLATVDSWRTCMHDEGYDFSKLDDALEQAGTRSGDLTSPASIQLAVHDYACRHQARVEETRAAIIEELTDTWLTEHLDAVERLNAARQTLVANSRATTAAG